MNRRQRWTGARVLLAAFAGLLAGSAHGQLPILEGLEYPPLNANPPKAEKVVLKNGMRLFLLEDHELPILNITAYIKTGDIYDPPGKTGLAGMTASVMRSGGTATRTPDEINEALEFIAGSIEAGMSDEYGSASLNVLVKDADMGVQLFADILMNPAFQEEKVELQRGQLIEAIRRRNDSPLQTAFREMQVRLYGDHPYARYATIDSAMAISREDMIAFHRAHYRPEGIWMAVSGDFQTDAIVQKIEKAFEGWDPPAVEHPETPAPQFKPGGIYHIEKEIAQTYIVFGHAGIQRTNPDWHSILVMNDILGGSGFTSRLMRKIRNERGLTYGISTNFFRKNQDGFFFGYSSTDHQNTVELIQLAKETMAEMRANPVSDMELALVKNQNINSFVFLYTSSAQIAAQSLVYQFLGYPEGYLESWTNNVAAVTKESALAAAEKYLNLDDLVIVTVGQREKFGRPLEELGEVEEILLKSPDK